MNRNFIPADYFPVLVQSVVALGFVGATMLATHYIGGKRKKFHTVRKDQNFECGIEVKGNARFPFSVKYFLIAILFVLFDVEIIFFYPWESRSLLFNFSEGICARHGQRRRENLT